MPILITCQRCGEQCNAPDSSAGGQVICPHCSAPIHVAEIAPPGLPAKAENWERQFKRPVTYVQPAQSAPQQPAHEPTVNVVADDPYGLSKNRDHGSRSRRSQRETKTSNSFAIASLVISVLSVLTMCLPFFNLVISGIGLTLGVTGIAVAIYRSGAGMGFAIAGTLMSGLTIALPAFLTAAAFSLPVVQKLQQDRGIRQAGSTPSEKRHAFRKLAIVNDVAVGVERVTTGTLKLKDGIGDGESETPEKYLTVWVQTANRSKTKKIPFGGWTSTAMMFSKPALTDEHGNRYRTVSLGMFRSIAGAEPDDDIYPEKKRSDPIVFELPVDAATKFNLDLPALPFNGDGLLKFEFSRENIREE